MEMQPHDAGRGKRRGEERIVAWQREVEARLRAMGAQAHRVSGRRLEQHHVDPRRGQRGEIVDVPPNAATPAVDDEDDRRPTRRRERHERVVGHEATLGN